MFPSVKSYYLSQNQEIKDRKIAVPCLNRLMTLLSNPMLKVYCQFLNSALTSQINFNLLFQRLNLVMYASLPSRFMQPEFAKKLKAGNLNTFVTENVGNYLSSDSMFISIVRNSLEFLLDDGEGDKEHDYKFL